MQKGPVSAMKLKFKVQPYQTMAVDAVVDCFAGQPFSVGPAYRIDPGKRNQAEAFDDEGFRNPDIALTDAQLLTNINAVQRRQNLPQSPSLTSFVTRDAKGRAVPAPAAYLKNMAAAAPLHLDVEMETGTGKTYCYIKTMFELNRRYGWSKFIIIVPSIAIREGVAKSLSITAEHFTETYGKKARFFIYNSKRLHELESFSSDAGLNVMVMNIQAFNASGKDNRRIYDALDDFQSRKPIDVIAANRPILILDEPQKMEGKATVEAFPKFRPLFIMRYSATHRTEHTKIHRLDALDAYNQKLVKKIQVRGIALKGLTGTTAYLYLEGIETVGRGKGGPFARLEMEIKDTTGTIKRRLKRLKFRDDLYDLSGGLDQYRDFVVSQIDATADTVEFTNGITLKAGEAYGDLSERDIRRIQIRETIRAHLEKERQLFAQGVKVLSLFFIDEVAKYRDYSRDDQNGEYARMFEEEYAEAVALVLAELPLDEAAWRKHLEAIPVAKTHDGYFSIDKKTKRLKDPEVGARSTDSDDSDAYDLILKNKERLLSFDEPVRFLFSHSALREGWDNPNVFVMCMLKHSENTVSRRQEVGRGLRLAVDRFGDRLDHPATVHDINILSVIASESYTDFVAGLQKEIAESLSARPRKASQAFFVGKQLHTPEGPVTVTDQMATQIHRYLIKHDYIDDADQITDTYYTAKAEGTLAVLHDDLVPYQAEVFSLIDSVYSDAALPKFEDGRKPKRNPLNDNFHKGAFQELWSRINRKAVYRVEFDTAELIQKCISALNSELRVTKLQYTVQTGIQSDEVTDEQLRGGTGFSVTRNETVQAASARSAVKYDLLGKVSDATDLLRQTVAQILTGIEPAIFDQYRANPEHFISEAARLIKEQKAGHLIEQLVYDPIDERYDADIFTAAEIGQDFSRATERLKNHVFDYCITDSGVERDFVGELDTSAEVEVYAKLPRGFLIPTPVGDYNPDWAIVFRAGAVKHIYFVAETKGSMSSLALRDLERAKIDCAKKFFAKLAESNPTPNVRYGVADSYNKLMEIVTT
jgi:type III restriction enzyme